MSYKLMSAYKLMSVLSTVNSCFYSYLPRICLSWQLVQLDVNEVFLPQGVLSL